MNATCGSMAMIHWSRMTPTGTLFIALLSTWGVRHMVVRVVFKPWRKRRKRT